MVVIKEGLQVEDLNQQIAILKLWERQYQGEFDKASGQWKKVSGHRLDITKGVLKNLLALKGAIEQDRHPIGPDAGPQGPTGDPGPPEGAFVEEVALEKALHPDEFGGEDFPSERPVPGAGLISQLEKNSDEKGWTELGNDHLKSGTIFVADTSNDKDEKNLKGLFIAGVDPYDHLAGKIDRKGGAIIRGELRWDGHGRVIFIPDEYGSITVAKFVEAPAKEPELFDVSELEKKVQDFAEYLYPGDLGHQVLVAEVILEWFNKNKPS